MKHQEHINKIIEETPRSTPCFVYELDGYDVERLVTFAPITKGDYITIKLTDGTFLRDKKVKKVIHYADVINMEDQILTSAIELED